jgi:hypothetical protein
MTTNWNSPIAEVNPTEGRKDFLLNIGDVVLYNYLGYKRYDSFDKSRSLEVIEVSTGPTGNVIFRGKQQKNVRYNTNGTAPAGWLETPFLSSKYFRVVTPAVPVESLKGSPQPLPVDTLIVDATTLKVLKACNNINQKSEVEAILRRDMNQKLFVFARVAEVSVGELPVKWDWK